MIRQERLLALAGTVMLVLGSPARADVIEIGAEGAQWKAGGAGDMSGVLTIGAPVGAPGEQLQVPDSVQVPSVAIADLSIAPGVVPEPYRDTVAGLAARYDLSPALIEALVWQESRWNPAAVSPVGARGLGQLMPGTARELGVNPDDPYANLEGAARYLRIQLDRFGDLELALAAYNAGPARVQRARGIPRIRETQNYVASIMGRLSNYSRSE